jgi:hypothetical protein
MPQTSNWHLPSELPPTYSNKNHNALGLQIGTYQVNCYPPTLKTTRPCWTSNCHLPTRWIATYSSSSSSSNYHLPSELLPTYSNRNHNALDFKVPPTYQVDCYLLFLCFKLPPTKWIATPSKTTATYLPSELLPSLVVVVRYLLV